jgi:hypothetical protein
MPAYAPQPSKSQSVPTTWAIVCVLAAIAAGLAGYVVHQVWPIYSVDVLAGLFGGFVGLLLTLGRHFFASMHPGSDVKPNNNLR